MRLGFLGSSFSLILACNTVHLEPTPEGGSDAGGDGPTSTSSTGGQGGDEPLACTPLAGPLELGCIERNNTQTGVSTAIDDNRYFHFLSVSKSVDYEGMLCAYGALTFGATSIDGGAAGACFRFTTDPLLETPSFALMPDVSLLLAARERRALVSLATGEPAGPPSFLGPLSLLEEDGSIAWSRMKYEGALDNLSSFEDSLLLDGGDVAVTLILGTGDGGTVDFGDGFVFTDDGGGDTAYLARFDALTGATVAAFALPTDPGAFHARPIQGADGSVTALVASSEGGPTTGRWYALEGGAAVELGRFDDVSNASAALVDARGDLWVSGAAEGVRKIDRDGACRYVGEFLASVPFYAHDLALLPSGNLAVLVNVLQGEPNVDGCQLTDFGEKGEAFAAEITPEGDWVRVARLTTDVPEGSRFAAVAEDDLVIYSLWGDAVGHYEQRIDRFDWSEMAF